jgi:RNase P/RNase MRP subunit p29
MIIHDSRHQIETIGFKLSITHRTLHAYTAISIKVVHEQSGKVEYERERLLGIAKKLMNFHSDSQQPFALVFDFSALLVDNLN